MTSFEITNIYVGEVEFEGQTFTKARAILSDGRELSVANDVADLRALGSMDAVKASLRMYEGQYGPYLRMTRYSKKEELFD